MAHAKSTDKQLCNDLAQFEDTVTRLGNLGPQNSVKDMQTLTQKAKTTGQRGPRRDQHPLIGPGDARAVSGRGSRQAVGCVRGRSGDDARAAWAPWYRFISKLLAQEPVFSFTSSTCSSGGSRPHAMSSQTCGS